MKKKKRLILRQRATRQRKREISEARQARNREMIKEQRRRSRALRQARNQWQRQEARRRWQEEKLKVSLKLPEKKNQVFGFEDPNIQRSPLLQYFQGVLNSLSEPGIVVVPWRP